MRLGFYTGAMRDAPWERVLTLAAMLGVDCLEVYAAPGSPHFDPDIADAGARKAFAASLARHGIRVSALAWYEGAMTDPARTAAVQARVARLIDAAADLGVTTVCMLPGFTVGDETRAALIEHRLPAIFRPILARAARRKVRIAVENFYRGALAGPDEFDALLDAIPEPHFGLNYDPSHLLHQGLDPLEPVRRHGARILHTHAKDTRLNPDGGWAYALPGDGVLDWTAYLGGLARAKYSGALIVEHEDAEWALEPGLARAFAHLRGLRTLKS